jgi:hypothetical protein
MLGRLYYRKNQDKLDEEPIKDSINMDIYMMVNTNLY